MIKKLSEADEEVKKLKKKLNDIKVPSTRIKLPGET